MKVWQEISAQIASTTHNQFLVEKSVLLGGGCINRAYCISGNDQRYFLKLNTPDSLTMFEAEATGLMEIFQSQTLHVPMPICYGQNAEFAWLVLEFISLGSGNRDSATKLGLQLAAMHRTTSKHFGWIRDNTIGKTPQINTPSANWLEFWRTQRLG
ncbi:MAG: fructosamine kinase family protein, partial [Nitrosomonas sp. PRO4]|nr:fructosamine kinase family protein [Nitrosomonas sp. PRO4]